MPNKRIPGGRSQRVQNRAAQRRRALREILSQAGMTPTEAARAAGFTRPNLLFNFLNGRSATLSQDTYERLAEVIPGATIASLAGVEPPDNVGPIARPLQVRAAAMAGLMQPSFDLAASQQSQVVVPIEDGLHAAGAFGVTVREPGAENLFTPGTILVCVPMTSYDGPIVNAKKLILQRIRDGKVEVTVRELQLEANEAWLWLRSAHPEHQTPVRMPFVPSQPIQSWRIGEDRFSVAAVVVSAFIPNL